MQVPRNTIVRISGDAKGNFGASGDYTFVCGNDLRDFAMYIYGDVEVVGV